MKTDYLFIDAQVQVNTVLMRTVYDISDTHEMHDYCKEQNKRPLDVATVMCALTMPELVVSAPHLGVVQKTTILEEIIVTANVALTSLRRMS